MPVSRGSRLGVHGALKDCRRSSADVVKSIIEVFTPLPQTHGIIVRRFHETAVTRRCRHQERPTRYPFAFAMQVSCWVLSSVSRCTANISSSTFRLAFFMHLVSASSQPARMARFANMTHCLPSCWADAFFSRTMFFVHRQG